MGNLLFFYCILSVWGSGMMTLKKTVTSKKAERESFAETRRDGRTVVNADKLLKSSSVRTMLKKMVTTRSGFVGVKATD